MVVFGPIGTLEEQTAIMVKVISQLNQCVINLVLSVSGAIVFSGAHLTPGA